MNLGVDVGGTWLRACLADGARVVRRGKMPSARPFDLARALKTLLSRWGGPALERLTIGSTGVWTPGQRRALERSLRGLARRVRALSDAELAHAAAFAGGRGVLLVAGTGSIALARDDQGRLARAGGLGPLLGDEGSGFWLGRRALAELPSRFPDGLALKLAHAPEPVRETAKLARRALAWASDGDRAARRLRAEAGRALAELAERAAAQARLKGPVKVCAHGGLLRDRGLRRDVGRALGRRFELVEPALEADVAAAMLECRP